MYRWQRQLKKMRSERGRRGGLASAESKRRMRELIAAMDPIKFSGEIDIRIIVIKREKTAREIVFYDFDGYRDKKRKLNGILAA